MRGGFGVIETGISQGHSPNSRKLRNLLLVGTSIALCAGLPGVAQAADECGVPAGGTVTCPAGNYPTGISYPNQVEDLTIVLEDGVDVTGTVQSNSSTTGVELRVEGETGTQVTSTAAPGISITSSQGTVFVGADDVDTSDTGATGIAAASNANTTVVADTVATTGLASPGINASTDGFFDGSDHASGDVSVTSNSVETSGDFSGAIIARAGGFKYGGGDVTVVSGTVATEGDYSGGIYAASHTGSKYGTAGTVSVTSESVTTQGEYSTGIFAASDGGSVAVDSGTVVANDD